jgi:hypothetical protein
MGKARSGPRLVGTSGVQAARVDRNEWFYLPKLFYLVSYATTKGVSE